MSTPPGSILLVEDDANDVWLIQRAFRKANLDSPCLIVNNGDDAIAYLAGEGRYADREGYPLPQLMLLDLKLPCKSGLEVLAWLRQRPGIKRLPVVVLTSSKETVDIQRAYDLGANSYLVEPVSFEALQSMVSILHQYWLMFNEKPDMNRNA